MRAIDDLSSEGSTTIALRHQVIGQRNGTVAGAGAATLDLDRLRRPGDVVGRTCDPERRGRRPEPPDRTAFDAATGTATLDVPWLDAPGGRRRAS